VDRRTFLAGTGVVLLAAPLGAKAQPTRNAHTVGFFGPPPSAGSLVQAFQQGLRDLGYVEGQNIRIEYRYTDVALRGHPELFPQLVTELVQLKPDVLVVSVTQAALAAKKATTTHLIVMVRCSRSGGRRTRREPGPTRWQYYRLVPADARPHRKDLQLLKEALPETRVDLLVSRGSSQLG
jgi:putative ABC transport system substrate-binding protein